MRRLRRRIIILAVLCILLTFFILFRTGSFSKVDNGWHCPDDYTAEVTTRGVPDKYEAACTESGTVVTVRYTVARYDKPEVTAEKDAYIYLPFGYSANETYDVLYLLHGSGDHAGSWFLSNPVNRNVIDNLIYYGDIQPLLIVTPTIFQPEVFSFEDNYSAEQFAYELRNCLIPAIEQQYPCTAAGSDNPRKHRALAGLSKGSYTTIYAGLENGLDLFSRFGTFSGMLTGSGEVAEAMQAYPEDDYPIDCLFATNGFFDFTFYEHYVRMTVLDLKEDRITDGENYSFKIIRGAKHRWSGWEVSLYDFLLTAFSTYQ